MQKTGQWIGTFKGTIQGWAALSIEAGARAFATTMLQAPLPAARFDLTLDIKGSAIHGFATNPKAWDDESQVLLPAGDYMKRHPGVVYFPSSFNVEAELRGNRIVGKWRGATGEGSYDLQNRADEQPREPDHKMSWGEFKDYVAELIRNGKHLLFRGQADRAWKLRTTLHRHGRYDLLRYDQEDIRLLAPRVDSVCAQRYNLDDPADYGALLSLAQHHGFPTPLLDWTRSPYVAAFFALESVIKNATSSGYSRIFAFDGDAWMHDTPQVVSLADPHPAITLREFAAHNNPRHFPQQSVHVFSNVQDVESWVNLVEEGKERRYLTLIDIPWSERRFAIRELDYMGVSAATLFPGLEGICRALKERQFTS